MPRTKPEITNDLTREQQRLADIERARQSSLARLDVLHQELAAVSGHGNAVEPPLSAPAPRSGTEKIQLFRSLFRGRPDVYPARFVSRKTRQPGYAPACANKWRPGLCALMTGGKCGECANQAFIPVSDQVVLDHLQGRHVMGVYPLLEDETCRFLAVDFDKRTWREDVIAFAETCRGAGLPVAIERSRSGSGAHAWFFFSVPVDASAARRMGFHLITETMSQRHEIAMSSYDRLFPNQDTLPRGGFGNLIALPLQHEPRQQGNSIFVDSQLEPYTDQWAFLASIARIDPEDVTVIARDAVRSGRVVAVRAAGDGDDEETTAPWDQPPSGRKAIPAITGIALPDTVKAVLAQRLFIDKAGLPSALLSQLKRLAAFQNPEFYKKQRMRLSTALVPRVIACAEDLPHHLALPRGCVADARSLLTEHGIDLVLKDQRQPGSPLGYAFHSTLTPTQQTAAQALLQHEDGVLVAPPGIGKTVLGIYLLAQRACNTLIVVHRKPLLAQWIAQLAMFLDIETKAVGQIGGGKDKLNGTLDVAMIQSLVREDEVDDRIAHYGHIIVDECHHVSAASFEQVLAEAKARYVLGLTATPQRRDGHHPITTMQLGPVRHKIDVKSQAARRPFEHKLVVRETPFQLPESDADTSIQAIYRALVHDTARNACIVEDVVEALNQGRAPILLTERKEHLELLVAQLREHVAEIVTLHGRMSAKQRREATHQLANAPNPFGRLVAATGRYIGEGFDVPRLDTLFLAMPVSWKGTLIQYSGRLHRYSPGKTEVRIYDYVDYNVPVLHRMFEKRMATYKAIGYSV